jgi:hypothetical protein
LMRFMPKRRPPFRLLTFKISCRDWQVSSVAQIGNQLSKSFISSIDYLSIQDTTSSTTFESSMDETQWLELFHPFIAVRALYISHRMRSYVVSALRRLRGESSTEVLPALDNLYLEGYQAEQQDIESFIIACQHSGHPVSIHRWDRM